MAFTDWRFLFVFLPGVLGLYFVVARLTSRGAVDGRLRFDVANWVLVAGGGAFLAAGAGRFAGVLAAASALLYVLGRGIVRWYAGSASGISGSGIQESAPRH